MEIRTNYVLIGLVALIGLVGILLFVFWFARLEPDRQVSYYDVKFADVSGLGRAGEVRFEGLPVGKVVAIKLAPEKDGTILVRLEVTLNTPVRTDSIATIESQGVTGRSYVGISAGEESQPLLRDVSDLNIPLIPPGRSFLQGLSEDAPELMSDALGVVRDITKMVKDENISGIDETLKSLEGDSDVFAHSLQDFAGVVSEISSFAVELSSFKEILEGLTANGEKLFDTVDDTLISTADLAKELKTSSEASNETLERSIQSMTTFETYINGDLTRTTKEVHHVITDTRIRLATLGEDARAMLVEFKKTGEAGTGRLTDLEATIKTTDGMIVSLNETLDVMDQATISFDDLVSIDGAAMVADMRASFAPISNAAPTDLAAVLKDVQETTATANKMMIDTGNSLAAASGNAAELMDKVSASLASVNDNVARANATLDAFSASLDAGERTLVGVEKTFENANSVLNEDFAADFRRTMASLDERIEGVSDAIPQEVADLSAAANSARETFEMMSKTIAASDPALRDFASLALPQYAMLARETRKLIKNFDQATNKIRRNPTRFFRGGDTPIYKR